MPEITVTENEIIGAFAKALISKWKTLVFLFMFFSALFFAGGLYVYKDAKATTADIMVDLYSDVTEAKVKAKNMVEEAQKEVDKARKELLTTQKELDRIRKELARAQSVLEENIEQVNKFMDKQYRSYEEQIQQQMPLPEEEKKRPVLPPQVIEKPKLRKY